MKTLTVDVLLSSAIVIDGHADTAQRFVDEGFDLAGPLQGGNFNLESAQAGKLGAEFFAIWPEPGRYQGQYARRTLELIDAVRRQAARHAGRMELVTSAEGIERAHAEGRFAALIGIEGGHAIEGSLDLLRRYYALGARYMTLTWSNSNGWADSSGDMHDTSVAHTEDGLSGFGVEVVREMNRLGMMVDVSHVADRTFFRVLGVSRAPVIASHSCARALCDSPRNLTDDMLRAIADSGGVAMANFYSAFVSQEYRDAFRKMLPEIDAAVKASGPELTAVEETKIRKSLMDRIPRPPLSVLIDHIDHMAKIAGFDHVGLGSDFDGVFGQLPEGIDSAADMPKIPTALIERGYTAEDCRKILGGNLLRVLRAVEVTSA